jgi:galactosylgalactosylxylosylprotein 3-beta-glucuronosyltransferase 3
VFFTPSTVATSDLLLLTCLHLPFPHNSRASGEHGRLDRKLEGLLEVEALVQEQLEKSKVLEQLGAARIRDTIRRETLLTSNVATLKREISRLTRSHAQLRARSAAPCIDNPRVAAVGVRAQDAPLISVGATVAGGEPGVRMVADVAGLPFVYIITPTYARSTQRADLLRLCYTLRLVPNVHWVVVEDADAVTPLVSRVLAQCNMSRMMQVAARTPVEHRRTPCTTDNPRKGCPKGYAADKKFEQSWMHPRGVSQRNAGLAALRELRPWKTDEGGAFYFADDDNTYSLELFEVIRHVALVSVWEVGLSGGLLHEGPVLAPNGTIMKWHVGWRPDRPFPIDMAAFAVNVQALQSTPDLRFVATAGQGNLESNFLLQVVLGKEHVKAVRHACNCVLVWHTRTEHPLLNRERKTPSDPSVEV